MKSLLSVPCLLVVLTMVPAKADSVVATRLLRSETVIQADDLTLNGEDIPGALTDPAQAVGKEVRVTIYAGRPVRPEDLAAPAIIDRNQVVTLNYSYAGLNIATDVRALDRGGPGDRIRVMNLASRTTVTGVVMVDGTVSVAPTKN